MNFYMHKIRFILTFLLAFTTTFASADSVVIEVLASSKDNQSWNPQKSMHLTLGHVKNVEGADILLAIQKFNNEHKNFLMKSLSPGFTVKNFNTNGFNRGFNILEANEETDKRLSDLNQTLYKFLLDSFNAKMTDITSPKNIYPTGYTPHFEFIPGNNSTVPDRGTTIKFSEHELSARIQSFDR